MQRELQVQTPGVAGKCIASMIGTLELSLILTENPFLQHFADGLSDQTQMYKNLQ